MKRIPTLLLFTILIAPSFKIHAQTRQFENILNMKLKDNGVLTDQDKIIGYYLFYALDKAKKGKRNYLLRILDQNLNDVSSTEIVEDKRVFLSEAKYNGTNILLKFVNFRESKLVLMTFDRNAQLMSKAEEDIDRFAMAAYGSAQAPREKNELIPLPGRGFINYGPHKGSKGYKFTMLPTTGQQKKWKVLSDQKVKGFQNVGFMEASDDMMLNMVIKTKTANSKEQRFAIQGVDLNDGQVLFESKIAGKFLHQPLTAYYDRNKGVMNIMGIYYLPETKVLKENGLGLFRVSVNREGIYSDHKYLDWVRDFGKHMKVRADGRVGEKGKSYMYFHNIIQNADGSILAVGEEYRKTADAAGIVAGAFSMALGAGPTTASTKVVIEDMVLAQFTTDFDIEQIEYVEKTKSDFILPAGYGFVNIHYLSHFVNAYGGFDYRYSQKIDDDQATAICYMDYEKQGGGRKWIFGASIFNEGKFVHDKMNLQQGRGESDKVVTVFPAKPGYIAVLEYSKKERKSSWHLERLNY